MIPQGTIPGGSPPPPSGDFKGGPHASLPGVLPPPLPAAAAPHGADSGKLQIDTTPTEAHHDSSAHTGSTGLDSPLQQEPDGELQGWLDEAERDSECSELKRTQPTHFTCVSLCRYRNSSLSRLHAFERGGGTAGAGGC